MSYSTHDIADTLKQARTRKGLSQRALSELAGVPQSHISKIENAGVDLRLSSLVELARALDLELTLVPRKSLPAVQSIVRGSQAADAPKETTLAANKELKRLQTALNSVHHRFPEISELRQFQRNLHDLQHMTRAIPDLDTLRSATNMLKAYERSGGIEVLQQAFSDIQKLRNATAHGPLDDGDQRPKPAYSLDEDEDG